MTYLKDRLIVSRSNISAGASMSAGTSIDAGITVEAGTNVVAAVNVMAHTSSLCTIAPQSASQYMLQSGNASVTSGQAKEVVVFPVAFSAAPQVTATTKNATAMTAQKVASTAAAQFMYSGDDSTATVPFNWIAMGLK